MLLTLAGTAVALQAQPRTATQHRITTGDTLEQLARHYLGDASLWPQLQSHNQVGSPYRLRPGSVLEIPHSLLRMASASVDYVQGKASVLAPASPGAAAREMPLAPGQNVPEGSRVRVAPDAFVSIKLADGSVLQVQADSEVLLQALRRKGRAGSLQSVVDLQSGAVEASVPPNKKQPAAFDVRTLTASSSVRGTQFGVYLQPDGSTATAVLQGAVQVQPAGESTTVAAAPASTVLRPGQGSAVARDGQVRTAALLPAISPAQLPTLAEDAQWLDVPLPALPGATGYHVRVSQDAAGQQVLRNGRFAGERARFAAVPDGQYYLQVQPVDALGIPGNKSQGTLKVKAHPVAPLYKTAPQALLPADDVQLHCTPVHGVQAYRIQIAAAGQPWAGSDAGTPLLRDEVVREGCQLQASNLPVGTYQWRTASIRTLDNGTADQGPFAPAQAFRVAARPPVMDAAALQWDTAGGTPRMHWQGESGQTFRILVGRTPEVEQPVVDTVVDAPSWQADQLGAGTYYLRIQTRDPSGLESALSTARQFTIEPWVRDGSGTPLRSGFGHDVIAQ